MLTQTLIHPKHKKYRLASKEETYVVVEKLETGTMHRCFMLHHDIDDEFYLFEKNIDPVNDYITFEYSITNLYHPDEELEFEVIREASNCFIVSSYPGVQFPAPKYLFPEDHGDYIDLYIRDLDLDHNRLIFASQNGEENAPEYYSNDLSAFEHHRIYTLPVTGEYINKNGNKFLLVTYQGEQYHLSISPNYHDVDFGEEVECHLGYYKEGQRETLKLTRYGLISKLFSVGETYTFTVKDYSQDVNGHDIVVLADEYGFNNHYYPEDQYHQEEFRLGESVELFVKKITPKGYLHLTKNINRNSAPRYVVEDVFEQIGKSDLVQTYFYAEPTDGEGEQDDEMRLYKNYLDQYEGGENLWVFTFLTYLDDRLWTAIRNADLPQSEEIIDLYIALEQWVLEGSDYLQNFSPQKTGTIIEKAEGKVAVLKSLKKALRMIADDSFEAFVKETAEQVQRARYLAKDKKNILKEIMRVLHYFPEKSQETFRDAALTLLRCAPLDEFDRFALIKAIESRLFAAQKSDPYWNDDLPEQSLNNFAPAQEVLQMQAMLLYLHLQENNIAKAKLYSQYLLRYYFLMHQDNQYLELGVQMLARDQYLDLNIQLLEQLNELSAEHLAGKCQPQQPTQPLRWVGNGTIIREDGKLIVIPKNHLINQQYNSGKLLATFVDNPVAVHTHFTELTLDDSMETEELGEELLRLLSFARPTSAAPDTIEYEAGELYDGVVKNMGSNANYCFVAAHIGEEIIDTLLHVNSFNRNRFFEDIGRIIQPQDQLSFEVINYQDGKLNISPESLLAEYGEAVTNKPVHTRGKIIKKYGRKAHVITEDGWPVILRDNDDAPGTVLDLTVSHYDIGEHSFQGERTGTALEQFFEDPVELYRKYLYLTGMLHLKNSGAAKNQSGGKIFYQPDTEFPIFGKILITNLEMQLQQREDRNELLIGYFCLTSLAATLRHPYSYRYGEILKTLAAGGSLKEGLASAENVQHQPKKAVESGRKRESIQPDNQVTAYSNAFELLRDAGFSDDAKISVYDFIIEKITELGGDVSSLVKPETKKRQKEEVAEEIAAGPMSAAKYYFFPDNTFTITENQAEGYHIATEFPEEYSGGYLLFCYQNGAVNKVPAAQILDRKRNKPYKNGSAAAEDVVAVLFARDSDYVDIRLNNGTKGYRKLFPVSEIRENTLLTLRGLPLVSKEAEKIEQFEIVSTLTSRDKKFVDKNRKTIGKSNS